MLTLLRWCLLKTKEIKWILAFWQFVDRQATELLKNPEALEKRIAASLAALIHDSNE